jgi:hypothetical protein
MSNHILCIWTHKYGEVDIVIWWGRWRYGGLIPRGWIQGTACKVWRPSIEFFYGLKSSKSNKSHKEKSKEYYNATKKYPIQCATSTVAPLYWWASRRECPRWRSVCLKWSAREFWLRGGFGRIVRSRSRPVGADKATTGHGRTRLQWLHVTKSHSALPSRSTVKSRSDGPERLMQNVLAVSHQITSNVFHSSTVCPNELKLYQIGSYKDYDLLEFFQFFLETLNFEFKFQTKT